MAREKWEWTRSATVTSATGVDPRWALAGGPNARIHESGLGSAECRPPPGGLGGSESIAAISAILASPDRFG
jgi:hypothetical protein